MTSTADGLDTVRLRVPAEVGVGHTPQLLSQHRLGLHKEAGITGHNATSRHVVNLGIVVQVQTTFNQAVVPERNRQTAVRTHVAILTQGHALVRTDGQGSGSGSATGQGCTFVHGHALAQTSLIDVIAGHVGSGQVADDPTFHDVFFDGYSHYFIDGSVMQSQRIPVLTYDTGTGQYGSI